MSILSVQFVFHFVDKKHLHRLSEITLDNLDGKLAMVLMYKAKRKAAFLVSYRYIHVYAYLIRVEKTATIWSHENARTCSSVLYLFLRNHKNRKCHHHHHPFLYTLISLTKKFHSTSVFPFSLVGPLETS